MIIQEDFFARNADNKIYGLQINEKKISVSNTFIKLILLGTRPSMI